MVENKGSLDCNENKLTLPKQMSQIINTANISVNQRLVTMNLGVVNFQIYDSFLMEWRIKLP